MARISERTHPLFDENIDSWEFYEKSVQGGMAYLEEDYLMSHRLEHSDDFEQRKTRAYYLNFCDEVIQTFTNYILKEPVERPDDTTLEEFRQNTNNKGDDIDAFMRRVARVSAMYGHCHIVVDSPKLITNTILSKKQQRDSNLFPYGTIVLPTKLRDWSLDSDGQLNWVIIEEDIFDDSDPDKERIEQVTYKVITRDDWTRYDEDGKKIEGDKNPLGEVYVVTNYHRDIDIDMIGESLIKDIAYVNKIIYNWCSLIDEQIERQTFSQLVIPDDGTLADESEKAEPLKKIGTSAIWTFPADAAQAPKFIAPEVSTIEVIWDMIIAHIREIHRLAGLTGVSEDLYSPQRSGKSQQYAFLNINASLAAKAAHLQRTENKLNRLCYLWQNKNADAGIESVIYPTSFDVQGLEASLATTFAIAEREISKRLNKELLKKLSLKALPQAVESVKGEIEGEIESGDGTIKTAAELQQDAFGEVGRPGESPNRDTDQKGVQRSLEASRKSAEPSTGMPRKKVE